MFSFFKNKEEKITNLKAYISGKVVPITEVPDEVFSARLLGDGIGIWPKNGKVLAPADGIITVTMENTKHACGLRLSNGVELLLHVGLDTVYMNGEGFELRVSSGQKVKAGQTLIEFDRKAIAKAGFPDVVIMTVVENSEERALDFHTGIEATVKETVVVDFDC